MINTSNMIRAKDLKVGDKICSVNGVEYEVVENHIGDVVYIIRTIDTGDHRDNGLHLFYDDIDYLDYAKDILNIDLTTK